jgi:hypothetical protein
MLKKSALRDLIVSRHKRRQVRVSVSFAFQYELRLVERISDGRTSAERSIESPRKFTCRLVVDCIGHRYHHWDRIEKSVGTVDCVAGGKDE